jgi:predicted acylesterase/phospholipase RssA
MDPIRFVVGAFKATRTILGGPNPADASKPLSGMDKLKHDSRLMWHTAVGLSLPGGGAWGLAAIGLIRRCQTVGLPIDVVAGVSAGSLVAAMYAWQPNGPHDGIEELLSRADQAYPLLAASLLSPRPLQLWIDAITGATEIQKTPVPVLPFHTWVEDGSYHAASSGTLGEGVMASSILAPTFAPYDYAGEAVLDGGFAYNLPPPTKLWAEGAGFVVTMNVIPEKGPEKAPWRMALRKWLVENVILARRVNDATYGLLHLFRQVNEDGAKGSDLHFDAPMVCWDPSDFGEMEAIARLSTALAEHRLSGPMDPQYRYELFLYGSATMPPSNPPVNLDCPS